MTTGYGRVPLHGRLFAQWMHHVFPRECPYPHVAGTVNPLRPEDFVAQKGMDHTISDGELQRLSATEAPDPSQPTAAPLSGAASEIRRGECTAWVDEEELFVPGPRGHSEDEVWAAATGVAFLTAAAAATLAGARSCLRAGNAATRRTSAKELVVV